MKGGFPTNLGWYRLWRIPEVIEYLWSFHPQFPFGFSSLWKCHARLSRKPDRYWADLWRWLQCHIHQGLRHHLQYQRTHGSNGVARDGRDTSMEHVTTAQCRFCTWYCYIPWQSPINPWGFQCLRSTKCRGPDTIFPCCSWFPGKIYLSKGHQSWQFRIVARAHLQKCSQILPHMQGKHQSPYGPDKTTCPIN